LDAVVVDGQASVLVWEIKASRRPGSLHRALRQLRETKAILSLAFPSVACGVVFVDTGTITLAERAALAASDDAPERLPPTLDEAIAEHAELRTRASFAELLADGNGVEVLVLDVPAIVKLSGARPLSLAWDEDEIDEQLPPEPNPLPAHVFSTSDEDSESPFAAALRKANRKRE
jgi:hypothetical protein